MLGSTRSAARKPPPSPHLTCFLVVTLIVLTNGTELLHENARPLPSNSDAALAFQDFFPGLSSATFFSSTYQRHTLVHHQPSSTWRENSNLPAVTQPLRAVDAFCNVYANHNFPPGFLKVSQGPECQTACLCPAPRVRESTHAHVDRRTNTLDTHTHTI